MPKHTAQGTRHKPQEKLKMKKKNNKRNLMSKSFTCYWHLSLIFIVVYFILTSFQFENN